MSSADEVEGAGSPVVNSQWSMRCNRPSHPPGRFQPVGQAVLPDDFSLLLLLDH
jgi:hypothetical protein